MLLLSKNISEIDRGNAHLGTLYPPLKKCQILEEDRTFRKIVSPRVFNSKAYLYLSRRLISFTTFRMDTILDNQ